VIGWIPKGVGWTRAVARPGPPQIRTHKGSRHRSTRPLWRRTSEEILEPRDAVTGPSGAAFDQIMDDTVMAIWYEGRTDRITATFVYGSVADGRDRADTVTTIADTRSPDIATLKSFDVKTYLLAALR